MKIGMIIETNGPEKAWNAVRFANTALKQGHEVKILLMSAGVEIENIVDQNITRSSKSTSLLKTKESSSLAAHASSQEIRNNQTSAPSQRWPIV